MGGSGHRSPAGRRAEFAAADPRRAFPTALGSVLAGLALALVPLLAHAQAAPARQLDSASAASSKRAAEPRRPALSEAAARNRERIAASRRRNGAAPRFDDAALAERPPTESPEVGAAPRSGTPPALRTREGGETPGSASEEETAVREGNDHRSAAERRERERALRGRLLDLEWALAAIGASGLPHAPRDPNRLLNPLDAGRLRAEQAEVRRELETLAEDGGPETETDRRRR